MDQIIIQLTPFVFEDGNTYYFQILKRQSSNDYHDLYVYEKIQKKNFFGIKKESYKQINERPELVSVKLDTDEIKRDIRKILIATKASEQLKDWDGFVGNVPEDVKIALKRDSKLKDILS